jgi:hypothetical protein
MILKILYYRVSADSGRIRIYLENHSHQDFTGLSAQELNSMVKVLSYDPVYWDGTYICTDKNSMKH